MKLVKKLAMAITAVAICCTATFPMASTVANAACNHEFVVDGNYTVKEGAVREHLYANGTKICRVDKINYYTIQKCKYCDKQSMTFVTSEESHRDCGQ